METIIMSLARGVYYKVHVHVYIAQSMILEGGGHFGYETLHIPISNKLQCTCILIRKFPVLQ